MTSCDLVAQFASGVDVQIRVNPYPNPNPGFRVRFNPYPNPNPNHNQLEERHSNQSEARKGKPVKKIYNLDRAPLPGFGGVQVHKEMNRGFPLALSHSIGHSNRPGGSMGEN